MYKKFNLTEISSIQNNFIPHLYSIIQKEKCQGVNDFFKSAFKEGDEILFFDRGNAYFKILLTNNTIHMMDEVDKIELEIPFNDKWGLNDLLKKYINKKQKQPGQKSIEQILMDEFKQGTFSDILGKPYLVYDIETSLIGHNLSDTQFYLGYSMAEDAEGKIHYECIMPEQLEEFVQKMLNFDGYIVGFNQIRFDNPVCVYNLKKMTENDEDSLSTTDKPWIKDPEGVIDILNQKSLDLYVFIQQMTGKRMGLNKIAEALIGITKTLDSGASVEALRKQRQHSENKKALEDIKRYCKNDVRMTTLLFLYLLHFKKIYMDGEQYSYDIPTFLQYASTKEKKAEVWSLHNQSLL